MAAVELLESFPAEVVPPHLRLVSSEPMLRSFREGPALAERRRIRARLRQRRHRLGAAVVIVGALVILAMPGHTFGGSTGSGLSTDLADSSVLASGMNYVVQLGDTVGSIAKNMNPTDPSQARALLVHELGSSVVVPGEHVLIP
jgi:hypothetical protein